MSPHQYREFTMSAFISRLFTDGIISTKNPSDCKYNSKSWLRFEKTTLSLGLHSICSDSMWSADRDGVQAYIFKKHWQKEGFLTTTLCEKIQTLSRAAKVVLWWNNFQQLKRNVVFLFQKSRLHHTCWLIDFAGASVNAKGFPIQHFIKSTRALRQTFCILPSHSHPQLVKYWSFVMAPCGTCIQTFFKVWHQHEGLEAMQSYRWTYDVLQHQLPRRVEAGAEQELKHIIPTMKLQMSRYM